MAYTVSQNNTSDPNEPRISISFYPNPIKLAQLFDTPRRYTEGCVIQVEEIATVFFTVETPAFIDLDLRYFRPVPFIGTYQLNSDVFEVGIEAGATGFIQGVVAKFVERQTFLVAPGQSNLALNSGTVVLDACHTKVLNVPVPLAAVISTGTPIRNDGAYGGSIGTTSALLAESEFQARIRSIGFYINKGARLTSFQYSASVINEVEISRPVLVQPTDCDIPADLCDIPFAALLAADTFKRTTSAEAISVAIAAGFSPTTANVQGVIPRTFNCPTGGTRTYFKAVAGSIG
jgi:hypothetical protein